MLLVDMNNLKKIKMLLKMKCQKRYIEECIYDYNFEFKSVILFINLTFF